MYVKAIVFKQQYKHTDICQRTDVNKFLNAISDVTVVQ